MLIALSADAIQKSIALLPVIVVIIPCVCPTTNYIDSNFDSDQKKKQHELEN